MAQCTIDRNSIIKGITNKVAEMAAESGLFERVDNNTLRIAVPQEVEVVDTELELTPQTEPGMTVDHRMALDIVNTSFQEEIITPTDQAGVFKIQPSEQLIEKYEMRFRPDIQAQQQDLTTSRKKTPLPPNTKRIMTIISDFLTSAGVEVERVNNIMINGKVIGADGVALPLKSLIQHTTENDALTLTEEAMHIAVELVSQSNKPLFNQLMGSVNTFPIYKQVLAEYRNNPNYQKNGKPDINKIKKEAIGKLLAQTIVNRQDIPQAKTFWQKIKEFLSKFFSPISKRLEDYHNLADAIIQGDVGNVRTTLLTSENYLRESGVIEEDIPRIIALAQSDITDAELRAAISDFVPDMAYFKISPTVENKAKAISNKADQIEYDSKNKKYKFKGKTVPQSDLNKAIQALSGEGGLPKTNPLYQKLVDEFNGYENTQDREIAMEVMKGSLNPDGTIKVTPPDYSNKSPHYQDIARSVTDKLGEFPEGTKFLYDVQIADEKAAATIDLLAISPNETFNIINWQTVSLPEGERLERAAQNALKAKVQVARDILEQSYGVSKFGQSRTLLINTSPSNPNPSATNLDTKVADILAPIPTHSESLGSAQLDKIFGEMYNIDKKRKIKRVKTIEEVRSNKLLASLMSGLRAIQIGSTVRPLAFKLEETANLMEGVVKYYNENLRNKKLKEKDPKFLAFVKDASLLLSVHDHFKNVHAAAVAVNSENRGGGKVINEKDLKYLATTNANMNTSMSALLETIKHGMDKYASTRGVRDINSPELIKSYLRRQFDTASMSNQATIRVLQLIMSDVQGRTEIRHNEVQARLLEIKKNYTAWMKRTGRNTKSAFNLIMSQEKGEFELISKIDRSFYDKAKVALQNRDIKWVKENINMSEYKAWYDEAKILEEQRIELLDIEETPERSAEDFKKQLMEEWEARYDLNKGLDPTNTRIYNFPKEAQHLSKEYKILLKPENKPALDFYNFIEEFNTKAAESRIIDDFRAKRFLPQRLKTPADKISLGELDAKGYSKSISKYVTAEDEFTGYGDYRPVSASKRTIPFPFIQDLAEVTFNEKTGEFERNYSEVSLDLFSVMEQYAYEVERYGGLLEAEELVSLVEAVENSKDAIATRNLTGAPIPGGGFVENVRNKEDLNKVVMATLYGQQNDPHDIDGQITIGLNAGAKFINRKLGTQFFNEDRKPVKISVRKLLDTTRNIFIFKAFALNVSPAIVNTIGTNLQTFINSSKYWGKGDWWRAEKSIFAQKALAKVDKKAHTKELGAIGYFIPLVDNEANEAKSGQFSMTRIQRFDMQRTMFSLLRGSDKPAQYVAALAILRNTMVENGELVNIREHLRAQPKYLNIYEGTPQQRKALEAEFEQEVKNLQESKGVLSVAKWDKDGFFEIPGVSRDSDTVIRLRERIQQVAKDATGMGTLNEYRQFNTNLLGKNLFTFFSWAPRLITKRTARLQETNRGVEEGRFRTMWDYLKLALSESGASFRDLAVLNERGVKALQEHFLKKVQDYEARTGKSYYERGENEEFNFKAAERDYIEMYQRNLKGQLAEFITIASMFGLLLAVAQLGPDDDDSEWQGLHRFSMKILRKSLSELTFFYTPSSFKDLTGGDVIPQLSVVEDITSAVSHITGQIYGTVTGDEDMQKRNFALGKTLKTLPIINQTLPFIAILNQDAAAQLNYELPESTIIQPDYR